MNPFGEIPLPKSLPKDQRRRQHPGRWLTQRQCCFWERVSKVLFHGACSDSASLQLQFARAGQSIWMGNWLRGWELALSFFPCNSL